MNEKELILAISELIDIKLKPFAKKLEDLDMKIENNTVKLSQLQLQADTLRLDVKTSERSTRKDIHLLQDGMDTLVEVLEQKGILPQAK